MTCSIEIRNKLQNYARGKKGNFISFLMIPLTSVWLFWIKSHDLIKIARIASNVTTTAFAITQTHLLLAVMSYIVSQNLLWYDILSTLRYYTLVIGPISILTLSKLPGEYTALCCLHSELQWLSQQTSLPSQVPISFYSSVKRSKYGYM